MTDEGTERATDRPATGLLRRPSAPDDQGAVLRITPVDAGWSYVSLAVHRLGPGIVARRPADDQEVLVLVLEGSATVRAGDRTFDGVGSRASVFDGPPAGQVLVAPGSAVEVASDGTALVVIAAAPGGERRVTRRIEPEEVFVESRGSGDMARRVLHLLDTTADAGRLIAFEVFTPAGNWSSYPPHKHDTEDPPREAYLEEVYYYRFTRPTGFAFQRVYTPDRALDETVTAGDGELILVPRGYHVVGAAAGYETYYLNVMAGPNRAWFFTVDPDHAWLMDWDPNRPRG